MACCDMKKNMFFLNPIATVYWLLSLTVVACITASMVSNEWLVRYFSSTNDTAGVGVSYGLFKTCTELKSRTEKGQQGHDSFCSTHNHKYPDNDIFISVICLFILAFFYTLASLILTVICAWLPNPHHLVIFFNVGAFICLVLTVVLFPATWEIAWFERNCHGSKYHPGECIVGMGYILAVVSTCISFLCLTVLVINILLYGPKDYWIKRKLTTVTDSISSFNKTNESESIKQDDMIIKNII